MFVYYKCYFFDRIDVYEGIDVNKASELKGCDICHDWYFLKKKIIKFQRNVCNRWYGLLLISMNLRDIAIVNIKSVDYCCNIIRINKSEAINLTQNPHLTGKMEHYKT